MLRNGILCVVVIATSGIYGCKKKDNNRPENAQGGGSAAMGTEPMGSAAADQPGAMTGSAGTMGTDVPSDGGTGDGGMDGGVGSGTGTGGAGSGSAP